MPVKTSANPTTIILSNNFSIPSLKPSPIITAGIVPTNIIKINFWVSFDDKVNKIFFISLLKTTSILHKVPM